MKNTIFLLDYDGTLAETRPAILSCLALAFEAVGQRVPSEKELKDQLARGGTLATLFAAFVPGSSVDEERAFEAAYRARYLTEDKEKTVLFAGVIPVLEALKAKKVEMTVLSNKHGPTVLASIERFGLGHFFNGVVGSEAGQPVKPDTRVMTERVRLIYPHAALEQFVMVGDTTADLKFAQNVGMASCWARYGHGAAEACLEQKPSYIMDDVSGLLDIPVEF
ncbi:phosphoglycolate phosphatase [Neokomagataea thailandica NBRC 106555]|uniref:phosphoglycolate phosphatase n=2 Tax=Neokomagataea TaxID=1223423 RepID=A0A4Y6V2M8_9PROT|nr:MULTISPECIES: HAD family hydrolase [Neokomagataea]QDH24233.1 HAD family hydrolase [Neokomagataea tanensis]GBR52873.1 phosphoglycolate phosphatase [Neokomagataea thailandica NBRC 106555]